jgi:hypothetical protein
MATVLSLVELLKGSADPVLAGVAESIITVDQLVAQIPFRSVGLSDHLTWKREKALPVVSKIASGDNITSTNALAYDRVTAYLRRLVCDQDIDNLDAGAAGGMLQAKAEAIGRASKAMGRTFGDDIITGAPAWTVTVDSYGGSGATSNTIVVGPGQDPRLGNAQIKYVHSGTTVAYKAPGDSDFGPALTYSAGVKLYSQNPNKWVTVTLATLSANGIVTLSFVANTNEIDGMERLLAAAQTITASTNGDAITLATLDQLADLVTDSNGPKCYIMPLRTRRAVGALLRAAGGATMGEFKSMSFGTGQDVMVPTYNGIPILRSDFIPITDTQGSSSAATKVYCATLGDQAGLCGLYSEAGMDDVGGEIIASGLNGIQVVNLGTVQNADAKRVRVKAYWGVASKTEKGLAAATGITS